MLYRRTTDTAFLFVILTTLIFSKAVIKFQFITALFFVIILIQSEKRINGKSVQARKASQGLYIGLSNIVFVPRQCFIIYSRQLHNLYLGQVQILSRRFQKGAYIDSLRVDVFMHTDHRKNYIPKK